jgi:hypothetical protein
MSGIANGIRARARTPSKLKPALVALLEAFDYAEDNGSDRWEFAVAMRHLQTLGLSETDLRWLVRKGYVEHAREVTVQGDNGREFRTTGDLSFRRRTCFVLTAAGILKAQCVIESRAISVDGPNGSSERKTQTVQTPLPNWNAEIRELRLNGKLVKRFKWQAMNQEIVLAAFQEEGWPARIDDPLPPQPAQDSKRRLSDTIKCLNRKQTSELIHFRGDGTGEGIIWERGAQDGSNGNDA